MPYFNKLYQNLELVGARSLAKIPGQKVIFVRNTMKKFMETYLNTRHEESNLLIYSLWSGYKDYGRTKELLDFCKKQNIMIEDIHVSGHACKETVEALIRNLAPAALVPIHCEAENRDEFMSLHENCWMLNDGERRDIR